MTNILFCNVAYMQYYDIELRDDVPKHGGMYVEKTGDALEKYNFHVCADGIVRGFVETKYRDSYITAKKPNRIRIENIDAKYRKENQIENVTVVFCAISERMKKTVIVGWYKQATVYRERKVYGDRQYNIECKAQDAVLLEEEKRIFEIPRARNGAFGFGQSNLWYAKGEQEQEFVKQVLRYINSEEGIILDEGTDENQREYIENGGAKKITVNKYERNPVARKKCIEIYGAKCMICGFDAVSVYGEEFEKRIEVHHIVPRYVRSETYMVDPKEDLIPVCPNCHMILHSKMKNGEYPTVEFLKERMTR